MRRIEDEAAAELTSYRHKPTFAPEPELERSSRAGSLFLVSFVLFVLAAIAFWLVRSR
jgi:hypothetical protein